MSLGVWGIFFLKMFLILAGIFVIILLTPKLAAFIDSRRKPGDEPDGPRPERVEDEEKTENSAENGDDNEYKNDKI